MAANLPELYKNNVGPVGDRGERERCSVHSPNATQMRNYKTNRHISVMLVQYCVHKSEIFSTNWPTRLSQQTIRGDLKSEQKNTDFWNCNTNKKTDVTTREFPINCFWQTSGLTVMWIKTVLPNLVVNSPLQCIFTVIWTSRTWKYGCFFLLFFKEQEDKRKRLSVQVCTAQSDSQSLSF